MSYATSPAIMKMASAEMRKKTTLVQEALDRSGYDRTISDKVSPLSAYAVMDKFAKKILVKIMNGEALTDADHDRLVAAHETAVICYENDKKLTRYQFNKIRKAVETTRIKRQNTPTPVNGQATARFEPVKAVSATQVAPVGDSEGERTGVESGVGKCPGICVDAVRETIAEHQPQRSAMSRMREALGNMTALVIPARARMAIAGAAALAGVIMLGAALSNGNNNSASDLDSSLTAMTNGTPSVAANSEKLFSLANAFPIIAARASGNAEAGAVVEPAPQQQDDVKPQPQAEEETQLVEVVDPDAWKVRSVQSEMIQGVEDDILPTFDGLPPAQDVSQFIKLLPPLEETDTADAGAIEPLETDAEAAVQAAKIPVVGFEEMGSQQDPIDVIMQPASDVVETALPKEKPVTVAEADVAVSAQDDVEIPPIELKEASNPVEDGQIVILPKKVVEEAIAAADNADVQVEMPAAVIKAALANTGNTVDVEMPLKTIAEAAGTTPDAFAKLMQESSSVTGVTPTETGFAGAQTAVRDFMAAQNVEISRDMKKLLAKMGEDRAHIIGHQGMGAFEAARALHAKFGDVAMPVIGVLGNAIENDGVTTKADKLWKNAHQWHAKLTKP